MATTTEYPTNLSVLREKLLANPKPIIDALIIGLTEAGVQYEWDSGTIELLLEPIQEALGHVYGVHGVGNTGADNEALNYWRSVARSLNIGFDEDEEDEDFEEPWF